MTNQRLSIAAIVLGSATIVITVFLWQYERREVELSIPMTGEARFNHFLAAERMIKKLGFESGSLSEFSPRHWLPRSDETLIIDFDYYTLDEQQIELLLHWISDGGHLVMEAIWNNDDEWDPILSAFDIGVYLHERDDKDDDAEDEAQDIEAPPIDVTEWGEIDSDNSVALTVDEAYAVYRVHDERGVFAAQIQYGEGFLTVSADLSFASNRRIGNADHAAVLTRLLTHTIPPGKAWFVYARDFPGLLSLIWRHGWHLVIAAGIFLASFLWLVSQRFGPRVPVAAPARKSFLEHVDAAGAFLWQNHANDKLLDDAKIAFVRTLERRHPQMRYATESSRVKFLAELSDLPSSDIRAALTRLGHRNRHEFTLRIRTLQTLWTKI